MTLVAIGIAASFGAYLAVPSQASQASRLHRITDRFPIKTLVIGTAKRPSGVHVRSPCFSTTHIAGK